MGEVREILEQLTDEDLGYLADEFEKIAAKTKGLGKGKDAPMIGSYVQGKFPSGRGHKMVWRRTVGPRVSQRVAAPTTVAQRIMREGGGEMPLTGERAIANEQKLLGELRAVGKKIRGV